jgi:two-component system response regulator DevR
MPDSQHEPVGVVLIDDHRMFTESLSRLLGLDDDIEVLGIGANGREALTLVEKFRPRVLLIDYDIPEGNGVQVAKQLKQRFPETMIVMITGSDDDRVLLGAIEAGCSGYLTKDRASSEVANAVRVAAVGDALLSPAQMARLLPRLTKSYRAVGSELTDREREVLKLLARGATNKAIAAELFLSVNTIRNYVQGILTKLDAHSKLEAVSTAVRAGVIDYDALS